MTSRHSLAILMTALFILNILDYLTTIYALENIPNAYEANPWIKTPEAIFKFKILYGIPIGIAEFSLHSYLKSLEQGLKWRLKRGSLISGTISGLLSRWWFLLIIFSQ